MKKFVCSVCGYVYEGEAAPAECPICHAPAEKFKEQAGEKTWAAEHVVGVAQGAPEDIMADLRANFEGECSEVGMYLAMARVAHREGYPEIGLYWEKAAYEEAEHAVKLGADIVGPTLYGYTAETASIESPDLREFARMCRDFGDEAYMIMEGHIYTPEDAIKCLYLGAHAVVVGSAITRPHLTAKRFTDLMSGYRSNWRDAERSKH